MRRIPTAPVAAGSLIVGYAVAAGTGSRPLGGVFLAAGGIWCLREWHSRHDTRTAVILGGVGLGAFVASHILALAIGAWPSVLLLAAPRPERSPGCARTPREGAVAAAPETA